jgi:hypothetical protein
MGPTTRLDDILNLDEEEEENPQSRQISKRFIRATHVSSQQPDEQPPQQRNYARGPQSGAPPGIQQQGYAQNMISSLSRSDPRFQQQQMQTNSKIQPAAQRAFNSVEQYEEITIQAVANRIFPTTSSYIDALDDSLNPLHNVALGLLHDSMPSCDKTIYIIIIVILCIAIAFLLYRMNHT